MASSLSQLKADNKKKEEEATAVREEQAAEALKAAEVTDEEEQGEETNEVITDEQTEETAAETVGDEEKDDEKPDVEDWMKGDDDPKPKDTHTNSDMARMRLSMKGKLSKKDEENEQLRRENEELRNKQAAPVQPQTDEPKYEDFESDAEYNKALIDHRFKTQGEAYARRQAQTQQQNAQIAAKEQLTKDVDAHYDRAVTLAQDSGISAEVYQAADFKVRQAVESIRPKEGDYIVDTLISVMGAGSERVMFNLSKNSDRMNKLINAIQSDPTGLKATAFVATLNAELGKPRKKVTQAPKPASEANGDSTVKASVEAKRMKKQYDAAGNDMQKMFNVRRAARKAGVDVSGW